MSREDSLGFALRFPDRQSKHVCSALAYTETFYLRCAVALFAEFVRRFDIKDCQSTGYVYSFLEH